MKHTIVIGFLALSACTSSTGTTDQWLGASPGAGPAQVGGSPANTTNTFDGTYTGISLKTAGGGSTGPRTVGTTVNPPCQQFDKPPTLIVSNGLHNSTHSVLPSQDT